VLTLDRRHQLREVAIADDPPELALGLEAQIKRRIKEDCSPRHVPDSIHAIDEVPRTLNGKVLEVPVKRILMGTPIDEAANPDSLANPEALDYFARMSKEL